MTGRRRLLLPAFGAFFLLIMAGAALHSPNLSGRLTVDNPRFETNERYRTELTYPSVVRFVSSLDRYRGQACFGLVTAAEEGMPREVLNLTALHPELGATFAGFLAHDGFGIADRAFAEADARPAAAIERIAEDELAERILPPVDTTQAELDREERLIVGVSTNYGTHRDLADENGERFVFPKPIPPRGAYEAVVPSRRGLTEPGVLLDYEVEIGFVLLEEIDLESPPSAEELAERIALFAANDVTDRLPQILLGRPGYTRAKAHPGYLTIGPWMVHGRHLDLNRQDAEASGLELHLRVREADPYPGGEARQRASSLDLTRDPWNIVKMLGEIHGRCTQVDNAGVERVVARVRDGRTTLPVGTIILTGTPHGTAIEVPGLWDRLRAITRAKFSMTQARREFAAHCMKHRKEMGYLSVGDTVETWVEHLGRQRWSVVDGPPSWTERAALE